MSRNTVITRITLWVNRCVALLVAALIPGLPFILKWYAAWRSLTSAENTAIMIAFYCCAVVTAVALWNMDALLRGVLKNQIFTRKIVNYIRIIRWCCAAISLICLPAAFVYLPLFFMVIIMAFLALVITVLVRVMTAAVAIREENDLTI